MAIPTVGKRLLSVTLRAQPRDASVAIHPFVNFCFAFEPCDFNGFTLRTFCKNIPVAFGYSDGFKSDFRFCHRSFYAHNSGPNQTSIMRKSLVATILQLVAYGARTHNVRDPFLAASSGISFVTRNGRLILTFSRAMPKKPIKIQIIQEGGGAVPAEGVRRRQRGACANSEAA